MPDNIKLIRLPYSKFNYATPEIEDRNGFCNGFCLLLANYFLLNRSMKVEDMQMHIPMMLTSAKEVWNDLGEGSTSIDEAQFHFEIYIDKREFAL